MGWGKTTADSHFFNCTSSFSFLASLHFLLAPPSERGKRTRTAGTENKHICQMRNPRSPKCRMCYADCILDLHLQNTDLNTELTFIIITHVHHMLMMSAFYFSSDFLKQGILKCAFNEGFYLHLLFIEFKWLKCNVPIIILSIGIVFYFDCGQDCVLILCTTIKKTSTKDTPAYRQSSNILSTCKELIPT